MTDFPDAPHDFDDQRLGALRQRIGWLCHALRLAAAAYCVWILFTIVSFWSDEALVVSRFGKPLGVDVSGVTGLQRFEAFSISFLVWLLLTAACYSGWRLFSAYLEGRIFAVSSTLWLRRLALFGLISALVDIVARPVTSLILTAHKATGQHIVSVFVRPEDLSTVLLLATLLALAHIQKTAADIADENAQIV
ncbi:DUF2975 domain-containing protein [Rhodoblastus acidophilus]|uniref:DUF2975 domain-containing protein n=1 Tax=Candidatus Rhodoblastus alkanivorans TaxID=2954117 RepID=UPI001FA98C64|nr:DUF2975 domain-containing protein [Candidatus Rhodoblastus alkanivorans]MCI4680409.1 DUF2975 domain-containing protein [Candidatus Rhodoblastus alkanivorans]